MTPLNDLRESSKKGHIEKDFESSLFLSRISQSQKLFPSWNHYPTFQWPATSATSARIAPYSRARFHPAASFFQGFCTIDVTPNGKFTTLESSRWMARKMAYYITANIEICSFFCFSNTCCSFTYTGTRREEVWTIQDLTSRFQMMQKTWKIKSTMSAMKEKRMSRRFWSPGKSSPYRGLPP